MLTAIGLILNFLGSLVIASSVIRNPGDAHQKTDDGRKWYLASINHRVFRWGIVLLLLGFFVQLVVLLLN